MGKMVDHIRTTQTWSYPSWWNLFIALPWALGAVVAVHGWTVNRAVAEREQTTVGTITAHDEANHNQYGYIFSVNGKSYMGLETPRKEELHIGQRVRVYYDPTDPTMNALTDFAELATASLGLVPLVLFGVGALVLFIRHRRRRWLAIQRTQEAQPS
jgi:hypothetical protein